MLFESYRSKNEFQCWSKYLFHFDSVSVLFSDIKIKISLFLLSRRLLLSFKAWFICWNPSLSGCKKMTFWLLLSPPLAELSHTMLLSLLSHQVLIRQPDRSMHLCLKEHFTLAALWYLLAVAPSLHSLTFPLPFIFFKHHATIYFLFIFPFANTISEAIYLSCREQCVFPCTLI